MRRGSITRSSPRHHLELDAPATVTLHTAPLSDVSALAADPFAFNPTRAKSSARLVLVDATELDWQRARYREERHLFASADPVLVGLNTLQHWLWNRIGSPRPDLETRERVATQQHQGPTERGRATSREGCHEHRSQDSSTRSATSVGIAEG